MGRMEDLYPHLLNIFSRTILKMIKKDTKGWEKMVPTYVDNIIKENKLFGYKTKKKASRTAKK